MNLKITRFGGSINPDNNAIQLLVSGKLSIDVFVPTSEAEIYDLCYQLQPLVYEFCQREFLGQIAPDDSV